MATNGVVFVAYPSPARARWTWFAGSTNDCPFDTVNGLQFPTVGSRTVSVPFATTPLDEADEADTE